jgi:hypothetical protein
LPDIQAVGTPPNIENDGHDAAGVMPREPVMATRSWRCRVSFKLRDPWLCREVLCLPAWRDIKALYNQTILGAAWQMPQSLFSMVVFSTRFRGLAQIPQDWIPCTMSCCRALVPWSDSAGTLLDPAGNSLVPSAYLITEVHFPRLDPGPEAFLDHWGFDRVFVESPQRASSLRGTPEESAAAPGL